MTETINTEWLNSNASRAYPFRENASLIPADSNGNLLPDLPLPNYFIVDCILTVHGTGSTVVYLSQLGLVGNLVTLVFKDGSDVMVGTVSINLSAHITNQVYPIVGTGDYSDSVGRVIVGDIANIYTDLADGIYNFTIDSAPLEYSVVRPMIRSVRSLRTSEQGSESDYIFGHVKLLAGRNIQLTYLPTYNAIRLDAIDGTGFNEECDCEDEIGKTNVVRTINGIPIEDVQIVGDGQCVEVSEAGNAIVISDVCSTPCCGCPELEALTAQLNILNVSIAHLEAYANQLNERIQNFVTNYILTITG